MKSSLPRDQTSAKNARAICPLSITPLPSPGAAAPGSRPKFHLGADCSAFKPHRNRTLLSSSALIERQRREPRGQRAVHGRDQRLEGHGVLRPHLEIVLVG